MPTTVKAIFRAGAFVPQTDCHLPEGAEVHLTVEGPTVIPPEIIDSQERSRKLEEIICRMQSNPIPDGAPKFSRDELHERR